MTQTRRQFLMHTGCGALSASALLSGLGRFALIDTLVAQSSPYKALVCVFLFGGNDSNNMVLPYTNYSDYDNVRGGAVFAVPQAALTSFQINPPSTPGLTFALHPKLGEPFGTTGNPTLYDLWQQNRAAVVCNTGPLIRPVTRDEYRAGAARPYQLFSHSDQQNLWQTSYANSPRPTGWGGKTIDMLGGSGGNFPAIASIAGVTVFSTGQNTRPLVLSPAPTRLDATLKLFKPGNDQALLDALMHDRDDPMPALVHGAAQITTDALAASALLSGDPTLVTQFPDTNLGRQLNQVAKLISLRSQLGVSRQIFFASLGGFDTHTGQGAYNTNNGQAGLLLQLSQAIGAFYRATVELGASNDVTLFTSSDFSRTFVPGGGSTGTDHAWGSHQFVVGDSVVGRNFYGQFPPLVLGDGLDTDAGGGARGRWIPTTSVDQYAATLADWYGLPSDRRSDVFPNIANFNPNQILGFMGRGGTGPARAGTTTTRG
jgi:uncharacterized protein (DUF1501 family)